MFGVRVKTGHRPDYFLLAVIFLLVMFGLVMLSSASSELGKIKFDDSYYYLKHQLLNGFVIGLTGFLLGYKLNYQYYRKFALILFIASLGLLALVFTPLGVSSGGATRWIKLGPVIFQPAEILKLTFIMYLAAWLNNPNVQRGKNFLQGFVPFLAISAVMAVLLILQPATSMVVVLIGSGLIVYFLSGAKIKFLAILMALGLIGFGLVVYFTPYRLKRVVSFFRPQNIQEESYHLNEALIALGSGGVGGVGFGESRTKTNYLPAAVDDSIFAVIGEELGFIGAGGLIAVLGLLTFRLFWIAYKLRDQFGRLLLVGFGALIGIQSIINIGAMSGLLPLTGVPLPFISYGGTALAIFMVMSGVALNVSKYSQN